MSAPLNIDFYKSGHKAQYPNGIEVVFSNFTPRASRIKEANSIVFFGLQYYIKKYLVEEWNRDFFSKPKEEVVGAYKHLMDMALGVGKVNTEHIARLHDLGYLPLTIMALPEGSRVPIGVPPFVMFNTHHDAAWLPNYLETILSCTIWQACTSATIADLYRQEFKRAADLSSSCPDFSAWQGHDFSMRGMSSLETAMLSGAGHLLSFQGTDTVPAIGFLSKYYGYNWKTPIGSVPASEHSVMCAGTEDGELETFRRLMSIYPTGVLSVVSDTWDYWGVLTNILPQLKEEIMKRDGKLVIRPDSSIKTPLEIICGDPEAPVGSPENLGSIRLLYNLFGGTKNSKGFIELDSHIGLIYGDSITRDLARNINNKLMEMGFASTNWVAGIGSYTYQYNTRDTFGFAMKATACQINGEMREIYKSPKTDSGTKKSAKGLLAVYEENGTFRLKQQATWHDVFNCAFLEVFHDGVEYNTQSFEGIRKVLNP